LLPLVLDQELAQLHKNAFRRGKAHRACAGASCSDR
jgi:hypothetical protein